MRRPRASAAPARLGIPAALLLLASLAPACATSPASPADLPAGKAYVSFTPRAGDFPLAAASRPLPLYADAAEDPGVLRALGDLRADLERVTGTAPELSTGTLPTSGEAVLVGTLGRSPLVDRLVREGRLDVGGIEGRWETYVLQVVDDPLPGVDRALVVAGSDKRGTIFGLYDLSAHIGVSPWYWWADVPVERRADLSVSLARHSEGTPAVRYRGIFLNDENPALLGWANETFGGFNHRFYERVFELVLRLKGNYLWPAMWGKAFADDDPLSPAVADLYGVVMGTSHHEPMMRAHVEWERYGHGPWNYAANPDALRAFWREGVERMGSHESLVTIGMRGDGDEPMTEGTAIALLERIVADQRAILADVTGRDPAETPQVWALYKEVQDYYDQGMRVPDDVTLLFADDNWGNVRRLPAAGAPARAGGYGVYYHFDYVGGPRNYKWINTTQIERTWEQMHLAWRHGVDRIWIVNVGDLKPMELPISFFLDYAWDPDRWPAERLPDYTRRWAAQQFGPAHADEAAALLDAYTKFNARRKPEMMAPDTYSLVHYREAERVVADYWTLAERAERLYDELPPAYRDAFFQLVLFPVQASANLYQLYEAVGRNRLYARQGRAATNALADSARAFYARDAELTRTFHEDLAGGKWNHMMSQTHIGYTYWQQPEEQAMPEVETLDVPEEAAMGVAVEGSEAWWPGDGSNGEAVLPRLDPFGPETRYVEVFNRGRTPFAFTARADAPWLRVAPAEGTAGLQQRLLVSVDWSRAPEGRRRVPITIEGPDGAVVVEADVFHPAEPETATGFVEGEGYVAMEADHYTRAVGSGDVRWQRIANLGRTGSAMTPMLAAAPAQTPGMGPHLAYEMHLFSEGDVTVHAYLSPTLDVHGTGGLRYAVSIDDGPPQVVNLHEDISLQAWEKWVGENVNVGVSRHRVGAPGRHVLRFWMVDPGVVLQRIVVDTGGVKPSYLGPPESFRGSAGE